MQQSDWPVEMDVQANGSKAEVLLSLPELGYFLVPQKTSPGQQDRSIAVDFPFGLGLLPLKLEGDKLSGQRELDGGSLSLVLARSDLREEPTTGVRKSFVNGDVKLKGQLFPALGSTKGTIILLHGSEQEGLDTWSYRGWACLLRRMGFDVFAYDKRPRDLPRNLSDLASDAKAAVEFVRSRDPNGNQLIGLIGGSQAGWIAACIAAECPEAVDFLAISGWPAVTPREQELQRIAFEFRADGYAHKEIEEALAYANFYFYVAQHPELWPQLEKATQHALRQKWGDFVETPRSPEDLKWWAANLDYPTWDHLGQIQCPVFAAYGANDNLVPPAANAALLEKLIRAGGNHDVAVHIYPDGDHRIELPSGVVQGKFRWPQLSPDFRGDLEVWLDQRATLHNQSPPTPRRRWVEGNELFSPQLPRLRMRMDPRFEYVGTVAFQIPNTAEGVRYLFVDAEQNKVRRLIIAQFESMLSSSSETYNYSFDNAELIAGHRFRQNSFAFSHAQATLENPSGEAALTARFLSKKGLAIADEVMSVRLLTVPDANRRHELILFYIEPLAGTDVRLSHLYDDDQETQLWKTMAKSLSERATKAFQILPWATPDRNDSPPR